MSGMGDDVSEGGSAVSALTGATGAQGLGLGGHNNSATGPGRPPRGLGQGQSYEPQQGGAGGQGLGGQGLGGQGLGGQGLGGRSKGIGNANRDNSDVVSLPAILETPGGRATGGR